MTEYCKKHKVYKFACDVWKKTNHKHGACRKDHEFGFGKFPTFKYDGG